ncbi:MAG: hypothetical protein K6F92_00885 [Lachnospiraceae bacterium]|nr:hypothetical protein [Lachnospiraceae bacterium]
MNKDDKELRGREILSAMEKLDDDLIVDAAPKEPTRVTPIRRHTWRNVGIAAAAACAIGVGGIGISTYFNSDSTIDISGTAKNESTVRTGGDPYTTPGLSGSDAPGVSSTDVPASATSKASTEAAIAPSDASERTDHEINTAIIPEYEGSDVISEVPRDIHSAELEAGGTSDIAVSGGETSAANFDDYYGLLTAGRWNDNANWGFFKNLTTNGTLNFPAFGLNPVNRCAVTLTDASGAALSGLSVSAVSSTGETIYQAVTNASGVAYLFVEPASAGTWTVNITDANGQSILSDDKNYNFPAAAVVPGSQSSLSDFPETLTYSVDTTSKTYSSTQVMFILDTTGSMGDEISYLQGEFGNIYDKVTAGNVSYSWNFYRDEGDDYVTRCNDFTTDIEAIKSVLYAEYASGGGDTPEAVAEILTETMNSTAWKDDSVKIAFLILDAPPHADKEEALIAATKTAAAKGIHIIPVVASSSDRDTELFCRSLAIMTDGDYVFLTDDSGIGDSHLEPIIGDYTVESLSKIIIDIINEYAVK